MEIFHPVLMGCYSLLDNDVSVMAWHMPWHVRIISTDTDLLLFTSFIPPIVCVQCGRSGACHFPPNRVSKPYIPQECMTARKSMFSFWISCLEFEIGPSSCHFNRNLLTPISKLGMSMGAECSSPSRFFVTEGPVTSVGPATRTCPGGLFVLRLFCHDACVCIP